MMYGSNKAIPISFKSYKSGRITPSVLYAEVIAFTDLFDDAMAIRSQIEHALQEPVPMNLMTNLKSFFDIISKGSRTSEERAMLEILATRQAYQRQKISNIGFLRSEDNLADRFTKEKKQGALLQMMLDESHVKVCEHWIIRGQQVISGVHEENTTEERNEIEVEVQ